MKTLLLIALSCCLIGMVTWPSANASDTKLPQEEKKAEGDHEALEKEMKVLKSATRRLRKQFRKEQVKAADVLKDLQSCQKALLASKNLYPGNLQGEKNAKKRAEYTGMMIDCLMEGLKAEKAALAGDMKKATTAYKAMMALQKTGHDKFRE